MNRQNIFALSLFPCSVFTTSVPRSAKRAVLFISGKLLHHLAAIGGEDFDHSVVTIR
jgi:hypothetical protein